MRFLRLGDQYGCSCVQIMCSFFGLIGCSFGPAEGNYGEYGACKDTGFFKSDHQLYILDPRFCSVFNGRIMKDASSESCRFFDQLTIVVKECTAGRSECAFRQEDFEIIGNRVSHKDDLRDSRGWLARECCRTKEWC
jgi:hypothetical protein